MRHRDLFKILFLSLFILAHANASGQTYYKKIEAFTKVWGFLKYHQQAVAAGSINWDSVYVNNLPLLHKTTTNDEFNKLLLSIVDNLGEPVKNEVIKVADTLFTKNHDIGWINNNNLINSALKQKLSNIYRWRYQGDNKYIKLDYSTPDYSGERKYQNIIFPDHDYRLLFLSRFWNAINYFGPYKYEIDESWNSVLSQFIPKMINATDTVSYYKALLQLAVSLRDGHSQVYLSNDNMPITNLVFGKYTAPVYIDILSGTAIVRKLANDSLCSKANIKKGDIILAIDNEPVSKRLKRLKEYASASNDVARNISISRILFNTHNNNQSLKIKRGNRIFTTSTACILTSERNWGALSNYTSNETGYKSIGNSIAYIYAMQIWDGNLDSINALIKRKSAVIFDVRNYPSNNSFYKIFNTFLPEPKIISSSLNISIINPGFFKWTNSARLGTVNKSPYTGKVIILADERSQSQGEYSVMALQTIHGAVTIGSQTSGHDGIVTHIPMGGKLTLSYSGYGVFYPDKTPTQRRGVRIDVPVKKTAESVITDRDLILEEALKYLKERGIN